MKETNRAIANEFKNRLLKAVKPRKVVLFGSRARASHARDADMDILVVVERLNRRTSHVVSECAWRTSIAHGIVIAPVLYSRAQWEKGPERSSLLATAIKRHGITV